MKPFVFVFLLLALHSFSFSSQWPTGQWQAAVNTNVADIEIQATNENAIIASIKWTTKEQQSIPLSTWKFTDENQKFAQFKGSDGAIYQLRLTSFGELIFESKSASGETTMAFLKPVISEITEIEDYPTEQAILDLPNAAIWQSYAANDLWKFWGMEEALDYDTFRCDNGSPADPANLCRELRQGWISAGLSNQYTRMLSRQIFTYGVLFNITGDEQAYEYMEVGIEELLSRFDDAGSVATILQNGQPLYSPEQRTSQDVAYAQLGLAFAYYLSGDELLLERIDSLKDYIFEHYYQPDIGMLAWTLKDQMPGDSNNQELVSQLDQLNAYLLLVYPQLPEDMKAEWEKDIRLMVDILLAKFHDEDNNRFAGQLVKGEYNDQGDRHNDFGHSVKSYWMIYLAGQLLNDPTYTEIGRWGIEEIMTQAIRFREHPRGYSQWGNQVQSNNASWWEFAELTQATATLALQNPEHTRYLPDVYQMWLNIYVDKTRGGVWMSPNGGAKQHLWKNGYHEAELGLIALITSQKIKGEPVTLYFKRSEGHFQPYFYELPHKKLKEQNGITAVTF